MGLRLRYYFRLILTLISKFKVLILISVGLGVSLFLLLGYLLPAFLGSRPAKIGIAGRFSPGSLPSEILERAGNGLTSVDEKGNVQPNLASSWEPKDNGKEWIFKLNEALKWQDGSEVKSEDIKYEFSDVKTEYPDEKTIVFKLQNPYSVFPVAVSKPVFKKGLLGTGEWKVKKVSVANGFVSQISLASEEGTLIYKIYATEERLKLAFKLGEIDEMRGLLTKAPFDSWKTAEIKEEAGKSEIVTLFINTQDPLLSEKTLRQALAYAIKKDGFEGERAISPISEDSWAFNSQVKPYEYDPEKAKKTISELPDEIKEKININLSTTPLLLPVAEKIVRDWKDAGIPASVQVSTSIPQEYQVLLAIFDSPKDPDQYSIWHSTQTSTNITKYQSPRIDKLLEDGRTTTDQEERRRIYLDFQRFLVEDSPAIFLYYPKIYNISRK